MVRVCFFYALTFALLAPQALALWPKCHGYCEKLPFWKNHHFQINWEMSDEFYRYGGPPNPTKWTVHDPHGGVGSWDGRQPGLCLKNNVWVMRNRPDNFGGLRVQARSHYKGTEEFRDIFHTTRRGLNQTFFERGYNTYTTGMISSKKAVKYGYFEVEAKNMPTQLVNAWWFSSRINNVWTEIDVFENSHVSAEESKWKLDMRLRSVPNAHVYKNPAEGIAPESIVTMRPTEYEHHEPLSYQAHTYGLLWTSQSITWFFDGKPFVSIKNRHWHQPMFVRFDVETNLAWHGIMPNVKELHEHPRLFSVHYFRVYSINWFRDQKTWTHSVHQAKNKNDELLLSAKKKVSDDEAKAISDSGKVRDVDVGTFSIPRLKIVAADAADPTTLLRAPYEGETFGEVVTPPGDLTWDQAIEKFSKHTGILKPKKDDTSAWTRFKRAVIQWYRDLFGYSPS